MLFTFHLRVVFTAIPLPFMIRHRAKYRSGGIAILVKDEYFDKVKVSEEQWRKFLLIHSVELFHS